ncbi:MAG: carbon-nitrogen hydrolase family protein [Absicoccus sp.]|uniref:carbon-nitrogen hydrolase family protein n=1 Tax=Absicoccus sp. TaxID=2718527 RepID=UPI002A75992B|nr:carbon-nitrogen hydrolase family protein [Absicoccus sp.]MDY3035781.1 carbon-nitrogen hydrolase family protein [Absicoccus sp.]
MKDVINLAVVNFTCVWGNKAANLHRIKEYTIAAGKRGMDMIVFPETALTGYDNDLDHQGQEKMHCQLAETIPGDSTEKMTKVAKKYGMYVVFGMPECKDGKVYNSAAIIEPSGKIYSYRKIHLPFDEKEWAVNGNQPVLIQTPFGPVGVSICYDTYCFPELIRYYTAKGARLCLNVTACPDVPCTAGAAKLTIPAYAYINYVFIASANLCGYDKRSRFIGGSSVVGPAYTKGGAISYIGKTFGQAGSDTPGMMCGSIDLSLADQYTDIPIFRKDAKGQCDWRNDLYADLYKKCQ